MPEQTQQLHGAVDVATGDGRWRMTVLPAHGGALARLQYREQSGTACRDLVAGPDLEQVAFRNPFYQGVPLYPFVNRLRDGSWTWQGKTLQFPRNEPARNNSLHGFLYRRSMRVAEVSQFPDEAQVELKLDYAGDEAGYPFRALVQLCYHLHSNDGLRVTLSVTNQHHAPVPVGLGWHPYLTLGLPVDELYLQLQGCERVEIDERLLPTGGVMKFDRFHDRRSIGAWQVDHCFRLLSTGSRASCRLWDGGGPQAFGVELWQDSSAFPWVQLYIPPDRQSIAIEPVSCGIDALHTGEGLRWLEPGESMTATCGIALL